MKVFECIGCNGEELETSFPYDIDDKDQLIKIKRDDWEFHFLSIAHYLIAECPSPVANIALEKIAIKKYLDNGFEVDGKDCIEKVKQSITFQCSPETDDSHLEATKLSDIYLTKNAMQVLLNFQCEMVHQAESFDDTTVIDKIIECTKYLRIDGRLATDILQSVKNNIDFKNDLYGRNGGIHPNFRFGF